MSLLSVLRLFFLYYYVLLCYVTTTSTANAFGGGGGVGIIGIAVAATSATSSSSTSSTTNRLNVHNHHHHYDVENKPSATTASQQKSIRSNSTHIVWTTTKTRRKKSSTTTNYDHHDHDSGFFTSSSSSSSSSAVIVQTRHEAERDCLHFLQHNIMNFDRPFMETLGFPPSSSQSSSSSEEDGSDNDHNDDNHSSTTSATTTSTTFEVDGLDYGLIGPTIRLALDAKVMYPWTDALPQHIFFNYVLNYANLNEGRTNWRPLLVDALKFNETELYKSGTANITSVTDWVNQNVWTRLGKPTMNNNACAETTTSTTTKIQPIQPIYFKSSQTPLIFDPMSTIAYGYASCTGISILFCNALRAVGIPARVVGTPAWYGNRTNGNHNWVEVYVGRNGSHSVNDDHISDYVVDNANDDGDGEWKFLEGVPANPSDTLDGDPCQRWFCDPSRYPSSKVYAAKMSRCPCGTTTTTATDQISSSSVRQPSSSFSSLRSNGGNTDEPDDNSNTSDNNNNNNCYQHFPIAWEWDCMDVPAVDRTDYYTRICQSCSKDGEEE